MQILYIKNLPNSNTAMGSFYKNELQKIENFQKKDDNKKKQKQ